MKTLPTENPKTAITVDARGEMSYPSAEAEGRIEIELPSLPGSPNAVERLHAADFGPHVAGRIEASMNKQGYLKSGPQAGPVEVLKHYVAAAKGAKLFDEDTVEYADRLAKEFGGARGEDRGRYLNTMVKPFLNGLAPKRRQK